jgi:hypothetical protein
MHGIFTNPLKAHIAQYVILAYNTNLASPQGAVFMYKWNLIFSFNRYPLLSGRGTKMDCSVVPEIKKQS